MRRKLAAGNWKMNGTGSALSELTELAAACSDTACEILLCPPATLISRAADLAGPVAIGGQDCHVAENGAHTGDLSAQMLRDAGASYVILGHSERRTDHAESSDLVRAKAEAAMKAGLIAIICVGESLQDRETGQTLDVIGSQLNASLPSLATAGNVVIAYEPVWAIGTGKVPTTSQISEVHSFLRQRLAEILGTPEAEAIRLLYGGSVKAANAREIFAVENVDGALVGGASLKCADFQPIIAALSATS